jgi:hypothetical protein
MTEVVWSVIIMLSVGMVGVAWIIYYILKESAEELNVSIQDQKDQQSH